MTLTIHHVLVTGEGKYIADLAEQCRCCLEGENRALYTLPHKILLALYCDKQETNQALWAQQVHDGPIVDFMGVSKLIKNS